MRQASPPNIHFTSNVQEQTRLPLNNYEPIHPTPVRFSNNQTHNLQPQPISDLPIHESLYIKPHNKATDNQYNIRISNPSPRVHKLQQENSRLQYNQLQSPQQIDYNNYNKTIVRNTINSYPQRKIVPNPKTVHFRSINTSNLATRVVHQQNTQKRKSFVETYVQRPHYQKKHAKEDIYGQKSQYKQSKGCCSWPWLLLLGLLALIGLITALVLAFSVFSGENDIPVTELENKQIDQYAINGSAVVLQKQKMISNQTKNQKSNAENSQKNATTVVTQQQQKQNKINANGTIDSVENNSSQANGTTIVNVGQQVSKQPHTSPGILPPGPDTQPGLLPSTQYRFPGTIQKFKQVYKPVEKQIAKTQYQLPENWNTDFQYAPDHPLFGTYYGTSQQKTEQVKPMITHLKSVQKRLHRLHAKVLDFMSII